MNKAVLLINLGTPDEVSPRSIRCYLREFLNDARVVDLPRVFRWLLVNFCLIPLRYKRITAAYRQIWTESGSPLLVISQKIRHALIQECNYPIELGMRYGRPSIETALNKLKHYEAIVVIPLYPQYSSAATGSALEKSLKLISKQWNISKVNMINEFYYHPGFIAACADVIKKHIHDKKIDMLVFSYHGLPRRHINKSECKAECDHINACPIVESENRFCYRAQCYATTRYIAEKLGLNETQYRIAFQSRVGITPWIKPYTDYLLPELIKNGIKNIAIVSPSFVADCLETLEEINIRTRNQWQALGGKEFVFIPCVNDNEIWIKALADMIG